MAESAHFVIPKGRPLAHVSYGGEVQFEGSVVNRRTQDTTRTLQTSHGAMKVTHTDNRRDRGTHPDGAVPFDEFHRGWLGAISSLGDLRYFP